jgi:hypothetical protein
MVRRRGLVRSAARTAGRTALIAGAATAVSGRVAGRQQQKRAADEPAPVEAPHTHGADIDGGTDIVARLQQLSDLRMSGALTDKEFAAAKARLLGS